MSCGCASSSQTPTEYSVGGDNAFSKSYETVSNAHESVSGTHLFSGGSKKKSKRRMKKSGKKRKTKAEKKKMRKSRKNRKTVKKMRGGMNFLTGTIADEANGKSMVGHMIGAEVRGGGASVLNSDPASQPIGKK